ncbi:MAG: phosphoglycerate kinase [Devosia sp.]|nr:phosphoglycerate kinase [Devosia sp.]
MRLLRRQGPRVVIAAHLDRPHGVPNPVPSLAPVGVARWRKNWARRSPFVRDCVGAVAEERIPVGSGRIGPAARETALPPSGRSPQRPGLRAAAVVHGDVFANDAPPCSARRHASVATLPPVTPALAGPQLVARAAELGEQVPCSRPASPPSPSRKQEH